ncbi:MAG TPA: right-handed parallel beta-helix repeat-containing protein [Blastocatellia bacterium]|nr:right-handed parallel beta-helix repeat-containing protein [Blastocatellia bacterium]
MRQLVFDSRISLALAFLLLAGIQASAQSYVSATGDDANPCTLSSPCRTVDRALSVTASGGQVIISDSGEYPPFTVTRSVNVRAATGAAPRVKSPDAGLPAIRITLPADEYVYLEGLAVVPSFPGGVGIQWLTPAKLLWMRNCTVEGFRTGLDVEKGGNIFVDNCTLRSGAGASSTAIRLNTANESLPIYSTVQYSDINTHGSGVYAGANTTVSVYGCRVWGCANYGVRAMATNADLGGSDSSRAIVTVTSSWVYGNTIGLNGDFTFSAPDRTVLRVGSSSVYNNRFVGAWGACDLGGNTFFGNASGDWGFSRGSTGPACPF